jgi:hypothetical protein
MVSERPLNDRSKELGAENGDLVIIVPIRERALIL